MLQEILHKEQEAVLKLTRFQLTRIASSYLPQKTGSKLISFALIRNFYREIKARRLTWSAFFFSSHACMTVDSKQMDVGSHVGEHVSAGEDVFIMGKNAVQAPQPCK